MIILSQHNVLLGNFGSLGFMWTPLDTYHRVRSMEAWPWIRFCSDPSKPWTQDLWRHRLVSGTTIGLLNRIGTPWAPCHVPRAVPERVFVAWQGSLSCWRGATGFLSGSFHYNEMITVIHSTRRRFLTLNCDKPAKSASSSSLLLGTMLLVDGTKVQQGQWTPSFRPRLFSDRWKGRQRKTSGEDGEVQSHC